MKELLITDEPTEHITAKWDGTRLAIISGNNGNHSKVTILNTKEASMLYDFIGNILFQEVSS